MVRALAWVLPALLLGGCLNTFEEPERPHLIRVVGIDVQPLRVLAQTVVLNISTTLDNRGGGGSGELRLLAKAYAEDTGFLIEENETSLERLPPDTTRAIQLSLTVPRAGSVRIDIVLFEDELGRERASVTARNLGALEPDLLDTGLRVTDMDFQVRGVDNATGSPRALIQADLYLTNEGDAASEDLRVQVKAREVSTRLIADVQWVSTGSILPGTTAVRSTNLTIPDGYNYDVEILTWRGDVVVARNERVVQLAPTYTKPTDTEVVTTDPRINDFISPTHATPPGFAGGAGGYPTPAPQVPGPGLVALVAALAVAALAFGRWRR